MTRILVILIMACIGCSIPVHAAKSASTTMPTDQISEQKECGPSGLIQVMEIENVTFVRLQKGCHIHENNKIVGFVPEDDEILTANEADRYELPFEGAYLYFQEGRPHLSYLVGGERRNAVLTSRGEGVFTYSPFLKTLRGT